MRNLPLQVRWTFDREALDSRSDERLFFGSD
jgi:hypothetical protein